jgi:hypothetical protein
VWAGDEKYHFCKIVSCTGAEFFAEDKNLKKKVFRPGSFLGENKKSVSHSSP